ncbi:MAG: respiratory nitrate reductase subunit gamma, partial [Boseongicola sp. SB0673_bin_14]|nr:respiratory nitrate reductase subunit gamma [Boseongicola sp. SB0673_bin_14]
MHDFLFGIFPYIALGVGIMGTIARYERDQFTWKTSSSQLLRRRQLVIGSILFHVGVLVIFFGHLVGLLTPIRVFELVGISHGAKQMLALVVGGIAGVMALIGGGMLFHRRWTDPRIRQTSSFWDIAILALLLVQLVLGLGTILV